MGEFWGLALHAAEITFVTDALATNLPQFDYLCLLAKVNLAITSFGEPFP